MNRLAACPKCRFKRQAQALECPRCGIVFARWKGRQGGDLAETRVEAQDRAERRSGGPDPEDPFHWLEEGEAPPAAPEPAIPPLSSSARESGQMVQPPIPPWLRGRELGQADQDEEPVN